MHRLAHYVLPHFVVGRRPVSSAIYGTVSVVAVIVVGAHDKATAGTLLIFAAISMAVIWAVHVYASALASAGVTGLHWREALRHAVHDELGVLEGAAVPLAVLLLGVLDVLEDRRAILVAVWSGVVLLTLIPLVWLRRLGSAWLPALTAATVSGLFGLLLVVLKTVVH